MRRIQELVDAVTEAYPSDRFFDRFAETCREVPAKRKSYRTYDDALRLLDHQSWAILKAKAVAHFRDHRQGQLKQGFFNQLNEAFAYRHLIRQGYSSVKMLPESGRRAPDIQYVDGGTRQHCEVKTIGISDQEISRQESRRAYSNVYLDLNEGFFAKLASTIVGARSQIEEQGTTGLVYLVVICDDFALDWCRNYRKQLASFAFAHAIDDVHVKVGLRFNRRRRLTKICSRRRSDKGCESAAAEAAALG
jgi:hypothetical protein